MARSAGVDEDYIIGRLASPLVDSRSRADSSGASSAKSSIMAFLSMGAFEKDEERRKLQDLAKVVELEKAVVKEGMASVGMRRRKVGLDQVAENEADEVRLD